MLGRALEGWGGHLRRWEASGDEESSHQSPPYLYPSPPIVQEPFSTAQGRRIGFTRRDCTVDWKLPGLEVATAGRSVAPPLVTRQLPDMAGGQGTCHSWRGSEWLSEPLGRIWQVFTLTSGTIRRPCHVGKVL